MDRDLYEDFGFILNSGSWGEVLALEFRFLEIEVNPYRPLQISR